MSEEMEILVEVDIEIRAIDLETHDYSDQIVGIKLCMNNWNDVVKIQKNANKFLQKYQKVSDTNR